MKTAQEIVNKIEDHFLDLERARERYDKSHSFDDWFECVKILPEIGDLVACLEIEKQKAEGRHPLN